MTEDERALVGEMLSQDTGAHELIAQLDVATVDSSCQCGCGSIGFLFDERVEVSTSITRTFHIEGEVLDDRGKTIGGLLLCTLDGRLHDLDVHSYVDGPLPLPNPSSVRWHIRGAR